MNGGILIGKDTTTGEEVFIPNLWLRRSLYLIGTHGTGKSTLLENIVKQLMERGDGLTFIDPHGDSVERLTGCIPDGREGDVIYIYPQDLAHPFHLNPFHCSDPSDSIAVDRRVEGFMSTLSSLREFTEAFSNAPQMSDILRHLAFALVLNPNSTLLDGANFLEHPEFRQGFYPALSQYGRHDIREYWESFDMKGQHQFDLIRSSLNKLRRLSTTTITRTVFGSPKPSVDFRQVIDKEKVLLVNLANLGKGNGEVIGAFIVSEILDAALSRADTEDRPQHHVVGDEFQTFMTDAFPRIITEGRKYGVDAIIAHQTRAQLPEQTAASTLAISCKIILGVTSPDAMELAPEFDFTPPPPELPEERPITAEPLQHLDERGHPDPRTLYHHNDIRQLLDDWKARCLEELIQRGQERQTELTWRRQAGFSSLDMDTTPLSSAQHLVTARLEGITRAINTYLYDVMRNGIPGVTRAELLNPPIYDVWTERLFSDPDDILEFRRRPYRARLPHFTLPPDLHNHVLDPETLTDFRMVLKAYLAHQYELEERLVQSVTTEQPYTPCKAPETETLYETWSIIAQVPPTNGIVGGPFARRPRVKNHLYWRELERTWVWFYRDIDEAVRELAIYLYLDPPRTPSGDREQPIERELSSQEVIARKANRLIQLPPHTAVAKIGLFEYTIETEKPPTCENFRHPRGETFGIPAAEPPSQSQASTPEPDAGPQPIRDEAREEVNSAGEPKSQPPAPQRLIPFKDALRRRIAQQPPEPPAEQEDKGANPHDSFWS